MGLVGIFPASVKDCVVVVGELDGGLRQSNNGSIQRTRLPTPPIPNQYILDRLQKWKKQKGDVLEWKAQIVKRFSTSSASAGE